MIYNLRKSFGKRLREFRLSRNPIVTQEELAKKIGIRQAHISAIETGERVDVHLMTALNILNALNVNFDKFWNGGK